jgi:hypothetical protein
MQYALKIRKSDLPFLTFLNGGVEPKIEKTPTYLVFSVEGDGDITAGIWTQTEVFNNREISQFSPVLLKFNKK